MEQESQITDSLKTRGFIIFHQDQRNLVKKSSSPCFLMFTSEAHSHKFDFMITKNSMTYLPAGVPKKVHRFG